MEVEVEQQDKSKHSRIVEYFLKILPPDVASNGNDRTHNCGGISSFLIGCIIILSS